MKLMRKIFIVLFVLFLLSLNAYALNYTVRVYDAGKGPAIAHWEPATSISAQQYKAKYEVKSLNDATNGISDVKLEIFKNVSGIKLPVLDQSLTTDQAGISVFTAQPKETLKASKQLHKPKLNIPLIKEFSLSLPTSNYTDVIIEIGVVKAFSKP